MQNLPIFIFYIGEAKMNNVQKARCIIDNFNKNYVPTGCCCAGNTGGTPINATFTIGSVTTPAPGK